MSEEDPRYFPSLQEWRDWLNTHHADTQVIWIIIQKKASQRPGVRYREAVLEAVAYGWIDGKMKRLNETEFMQRYTPRRRSSVWSRSNRERAERLIAEGRMTPAGLRAVKAAKQSGRWDQAYAYHKIGDNLPQDLIDALKTNMTAYQNFTTFPPSTRIMYIHWINEAKRQDTRERRIHTVVTRSAKNLRPGINLRLVKKEANT
ncbi:MAG: YdeI/OmpD-associated family protein [Candidatus Bathyarchaeota archaeon]|nr:YdeI/OmpD-associated family protein [Candidatus Bathyarchaeota archaeon]